MNYIVTGLPRCGSTAVMNALHAGGMSCLWSHVRNYEMQRLQERNLFEPTREEALEPGFTNNHPNMVIKLLWPLLKEVKPFLMGARVLVITRVPNKIKASFEHLFNRNMRFTVSQIAIEQNLMIDYCAHRRDFSDVLVADISDVSLAPEKFFDGLKTRGWPILSINKAADTMNPDMHRSISLHSASSLLKSLINLDN